MFDLLIEHRAIAQHIASVFLMLAMLRWGGAPERAVVLVFVVLFTLPVVIFQLFAGYALFFAAGGVFYASVDIIAATAFILIALNANRNYTLWLAGFQVVAASAHAVRYLVEVVTPLAHAIMVIGPGYFQLILMLIGLVRHIRRQNRYGEYRDWRIPLASLFKRRPIPDGLKRQL